MNYKTYLSNTVTTNVTEVDLPSTYILGISNNLISGGLHRVSKVRIDTDIPMLETVGTEKKIKLANIPTIPFSRISGVLSAYTDSEVNTIPGSHIADNTITSDKIVSLDASKISFDFSQDRVAIGQLTTADTENWMQSGTGYTPSTSGKPVAGWGHYGLVRLAAALVIDHYENYSNASLPTHVSPVFIWNTTAHKLGGLYDSSGPINGYLNIEVDGLWSIKPLVNAPAGLRNMECLMKVNYSNASATANNITVNGIAVGRVASNDDKLTITVYGNTIVATERDATARCIRGSFGHILTKAANVTVLSGGSSVLIPSDGAPVVNKSTNGDITYQTGPANAVVSFVPNGTGTPVTITDIGSAGSDNELYYFLLDTSITATSVLGLPGYMLDSDTNSTRKNNISRTY